jgi:hypothetical protein
MITVEENREKLRIRARIWRSNHRWIGTYNEIRRRCENIHSEHYKYYGGKGIKNLLTKDDLKILWFRDKAYLMKKPSISRRDHNKNYTVRNSFYEELSDNCRKVQLGKPRSEATKEKLRLFNTGRKLTEAHKLKIGESQKGRIFSIEHRQHLREAGKLAWKKRKL